MARDPVCNMSVDEKTAIKKVIKGRVYYFCSEDCAKKFEKQGTSQRR